MSAEDDWKIPAGLQPKAGDLAFDLDRALGSVLSLRATVPPDAFTAETLGTERGGSAVLIDSEGIVLTIGYLITEASQVWLTTVDGRAVPGHVLGYDQGTGFGVVQALGRIDVPPLALGTSGKAGRRCGADTASARKVPSFIMATLVVIGSMKLSIWLAIRSWSAGALPR